MNYKKACQSLEIEFENNNIDEIKLKRQYRLKALLYHPDKNKSPDAISRFQEVQESYEYLMKYQGYMDSENETDSFEDNYEYDQMFSNIDKKGYKWILFSFLKNILNRDTQNNILYTIIQRISSICESSALDTLEKIDKTMLIKIYDILKKYKEAFHFSEEFIIKIENMISEKIKNVECII
jgi:curved DNA-binding protein CbpA